MTSQKTRYFLSLFIFMTHFAFSKMSLAAPSDADVLAGLKNADNIVRQGNLLYLVRHAKDSPRAPKKYRDTGNIERWAYRANGDFKEEKWEDSDIKDLNDTPPKFITYLQGKNAINITPADNLLYVTYEPPLQLQKYEALMDLFPGPNFVLGRNLSNLQNMKVIRAENKIFVEGYYDPTHQMRFRAELDLSHGYVAKSIERFNGDLLATHWEFGAPRKTPDGVWIPSEAIMWSVNTEGRSVTNAFRPIKADFLNPSDEAFSIRLDNLSVIRDARLGRTYEANYTKLPPGVATLDDLLPHTQQDVDKRKRGENEGKKALIKRIMLICLMLGVFSLSLSLLYRSWRLRPTA